MGFTEALVLVLLVLKLTGVIAISWWLVFLPLIVVYGIVLVFLLLTAAMD
ncbi:hypothetical protein HQO42_14870 [Rhodococcus fascians]|nr:hypothetical protein [Rhodococcus fascians]MBY4237738.1 hypothetical protein [Rhodococcus fascians]MBY4253941.1 hypothetical protein [Rhodococcus fascians]MBY4269188.1 hypothetical protein [Rhodococcus fascians]